MRKNNDSKVKKVEKSAEFGINIVFDHRLDLSNPAYYQAIHWIDHFELKILDEGQAIHLINCETYALHKHDMYLLTHSDIHTLMPDPLAESTNVSIIFASFSENIISDSLFYELMELKQPIHVSLDDETYESFKYILTIIKKMSDQSSNQTMRMKKHLFSFILLRFIELYHQQNSNHIAPLPKEEYYDTTAQKISYVKQAISYIKYHFRDPDITTKSIAKALHITPNYFGEIFYKLMGITCLDYIKKLRLKFTMSLLVQTNMSIVEIAEKSGYSSSSYFIRDFKSEYGMTPYKYRGQKQGQVN